MAGSEQSRLEVRTPPPRTRTVRFEALGRTLPADVYTPADGTRAGIVLVPGLAPTGKDDPRLAMLATTLSRVGFTVLVPDVPGFRSYAVRATDVDVIVSAIVRLWALEEMQPDRPTGVGAFSFAVGPAIMAALEPPVRDRLDFLVGVGGYHDLRRLVRHYTTEQERGDHLGKWIFALGIADRLEDPGDARAVRAVARRALRTGAEPPAGEMPPGLGPGGEALLALLTNTSPERVAPLLARLPASLRAEIRALNPADHDLSRLRARLILLHGRGDDVIPHTQSLALANAVGPGRARLFLIDGLAHVDLRPAWGDVDVLLATTNALLAERADQRLTADQ